MERVKEFFRLGKEGSKEISLKYSIYCGIFLLCISVFDQADRWALPTLQVSGLQCSSCTSASEGIEINENFIEKCNEECLDITDAQMGLLLGPALSITAVLVSLPLGWLADKWERVKILFIGFMIWSLATFLSGFSTNFYELLLFRLLLGVGQAAVSPTAYSLLCDYFPPFIRTRIMSIFSFTIYIGEDIGLLIGIISQLTTWRIAFFILGLPGLILAVIFYLTVKEPFRGLSDLRLANSQGSTPKLEELSHQSVEDDNYNQHIEIEDTNVNQTNYLLYNDKEEYKDYTIIQKTVFLLKMPVYTSIWVASMIRFIGGYSLGGWMQAFYRRVYGVSPTTISIWLAIIVPLGGLSGGFSGGWITDKAKAKTISSAPLVCSVCSFLAVPFMIGMLYSPSYQLSFLFLLGAYYFAEMWYGPALSFVQDISPPSMRSISTAIFFLATAVGSCSTLLVGYMNEWFGIVAPYSDTTGDIISYDPTLSLLITVPGMYFVSGFVFALTAILTYRHFNYLKLERTK